MTDGAQPCQTCGTLMPAKPSRRGRPTRFCSQTCRSAAHRERHPYQQIDRFPASSLLRLFSDDIDDDTVASALGVNKSTVAKWKAGKNVNLAWWKADAYAVRIGTHPALVWPDWIDKALQGAHSDA